MNMNSTLSGKSIFEKWSNCLLNISWLLSIDIMMDSFSSIPHHSLYARTLSRIPDELADHVTILHQGRIQQSGTPKEILARPANAFVSDFLDLLIQILQTSNAKRSGGPA